MSDKVKGKQRIIQMNNHDNRTQAAARKIIKTVQKQGDRNGKNQ